MDASAQPVSSDTLRGAFSSAWGMLSQRRASDVPEGYIDGYLALQWIEWQGGTLRLTVLGSNVLLQLAGPRR